MAWRRRPQSPLLQPLEACNPLPNQLLVFGSLKGRARHVGYLHFGQSLSSILSQCQSLVVTSTYRLQCHILFSDFWILRFTLSLVLQHCFPKGRMIIDSSRYKLDASLAFVWTRPGSVKPCHIAYAVPASLVSSVVRICIVLQCISYTFQEFC